MYVQEALNGGVVQTRHPTLLRPGEVQKADEMILKPGDPALQRAPGRAAYGTVRSTSISVTTNGTTALTSTAAFGTNIAGVDHVTNSPFLTKTSAFGAIVPGMTVVGDYIPAGTVVTAVSADAGTVTMSANTTAGASGVTVTFSDLHPGTFISGTGITTGTTIASITSASALTMSAAASNSSTAARTFSEAVSGLSALEFSSAANYLLVAKAADKLYYSALTAVTGTFTALISGLSQSAEAILKTLRYNNRHMILTGLDTPRVLYYLNNAVTTRTLSMLPVKDFPGVSAVTGSWSSLTTMQYGYYYFLVTEVYNAGSEDEVESTYTGDLKYVHITDYLTQGVLVKLTATGGSATAYNNGAPGYNTATHRRIYMSPRQLDPLPEPDLSTFHRVGGDIGIGTSEITLNDVNPFQKGFASNSSTYGGYATLFPGGATNALAQVTKQTVTATFTLGSNVLASSPAAFGTVTPGMVITSTGNKVPYGTTVISVTSGTSLVMSNVATVAGSESVGFGNKPTFDNVFAQDPYDGGLPGGVSRALAFGNFGINNIGGFSSGVITGVKVRIFGSFHAESGDDRGFYVSLTKGAVASPPTSTERWAKFPTTSTFIHSGSGTIELGGPFDTWGVSWTPADFIDGTSTFWVNLRKHTSAVNISHLIDGIEVTVYAGGNTINLDGEVFKTIILADQVGNAFGVGAAGPAPAKSTTGDIVNGQLILDDATTGTDIVASLPDDFDAFPDAYRLPMQDQVKAIIAYGRGAVIGCLNTVKRLNYFPKETDAEFTRGLCFEDIATDHGMVGPQAAIVLDIPGRGSVIVYQSHNGPHVTDAVTSHLLNEDIDWMGQVTGTPTIEPTLIQRTIFKSYPKLYLLAMYYVPYGGTRRTKAIYFSYHPVHLKAGFQMPAVGPVTVQAGSADSFLLSGLSRLATGHATDGKVYIEDSGTTDENSVVVAPTVRSRRFYAAGVGHEGRVERLMLITDAAGNTTTGAYSAAIYRQNQGEALTLAHSVTGDTVNGGISELWPDDTVETFEVELTKTVAQTAAFRLHYLVFRDARDSGQDING
jgi:hypothetical protein